MFAPLILMVSFFFAVDLLSIDISWAEKTERIGADLPVVRAIEKSLGNRLARVVNVAKEFTSVDGFSFFASTYSAFSSRLTAIPFQHSHPANTAWFLNVMAGPSSYWFGYDSFVASNGYDSSAASQWFASLSDDDSAQGLTGDLFSTYTVLSDELRCLTSFKSFTHILNLLLKKWRNDSPDSSLLAMPQYEFALSMSQEVLSALHSNLVEIEHARLDAFPTLLTSEALQMSKTLAGLVMAYLSTEILAQNLSPEVWLDAMGLLEEIAKKVYRVAQVVSKVCNTGGYL